MGIISELLEKNTELLKQKPKMILWKHQKNIYIFLGQYYLFSCEWNNK